MVDVHPPPPTMPEFDLGTEAEDNDVPVSGNVDQHMVNLTTTDDVMVDRLTTAEGHNVPTSESKQCRRSARLALRPTAPIKSLNKVSQMVPLVSAEVRLSLKPFDQVRFRTRSEPKGKVTAKRGGRVKCPNGCLKTFGRTQDAHRHANETMQCRGGGERKSYPCMQCSKVFTRSDALRRHCSPRDDNPPACKVMRN
ncbi:hypothetical protein PILCRDRAFT_633875 [Piloderma croceum F 1598]|uniref:C2H2-type domain-containing protein n=1 Tax=Piloderma croceum (strain F 1598) TaxID=765440 RepID=A0A0C3ASH3_PILCF|nr:hypothetical protein PILCRDRAFT_633875 [Piloderma croceum F 1598]